MFWDPNEETRKTYMVIMVSSIMGLYKNDPTNSQLKDSLNEERKMRDSKDLYTLVAGRFMVSYYKVD